mmetsp:Transcript_11671/g.36092  ORF Transcript_11671/g.36092 Transcript_11671/m.36092 type:complete len:240 (+) Transcript_11671:678-1397(+)
MARDEDAHQVIAQLVGRRLLAAGQKKAQQRGIAVIHEQRVVQVVLAARLGFEDALGLCHQLLHRPANERDGVPGDPLALRHGARDGAGQLVDGHQVHCAGLALLERGVYSLHQRVLGGQAIEVVVECRLTDHVQRHLRQLVLQVDGLAHVGGGAQLASQHLCARNHRLAHHCLDVLAVDARRHRLAPQLPLLPLEKRKAVAKGPVLAAAHLGDGALVVEPTVALQHIAQRLGVRHHHEA